MTIQELGSLGELVAAIATVATLIYLALQLRENTAAVRADARRAHRAKASNANSLIAQDPQVAALFNAGLSDLEALSPAEHTQFAFLLAEIVSTQHDVYEEVASGTLPDDQHLRLIPGALRPFLSSPGGRSWWKRYRRNYSEGFTAFVEREVLTRDRDGAV